MNLSGLIRDPELRDRLTLLAAKAGWPCWLLDDEAALARLTHALPAADLRLTDSIATLAPVAALPATPASVLVLLQAGSDPGTPDPSGATYSRVDPGQSDDELLQALKTCVNAQRFRDRFAELEKLEPITSLPRHEELFQMLARRSGRALGLLVVQLDHATHLYQTLDPVAKTDLLAALGEHIRAAMPADALLGFYDAACFVVALPECTEPALPEAGQALLRAIRAPLHYRGGELHVTASVGASHTELFNDAEQIWSDAWQAMRRAHQQGGDRLCSGTDREVSRRLPQALAQQEFSLVLQPQLDVKGEQITGVEALLRWHGLDVGELSPARFIPIAEQRGYMARIGDWVLEQACREASTWFEHLVDPIWLGVNVSPQQFHRAAILEQVSRYRRERWFDPSMLELELPQEALLRLVDDHRDQLYRLRDLGVRFSLDNLGSSLIDASKLLRCPADTLKIDRALINRMDTDPEARDLVAQICQLGRRFELRVVAVGVERDSQLSALARFGCTDIQGYLFSPPVPLAQFRILLAHAPELTTPGARRNSRDTTR